MIRRSCAGAVLLLGTVTCGERGRLPTPVSPAFALADSLRADGRAAAAAPRYRALSDSFAAAHDTASWWRSQLWLSYTMLTQGQRDSGLTALARATALAGTDPNRTGWTHYMRGIFFDRAGRFDSAAAEVTAAQALAWQSHDRKLEASAIHVMGRIQSLSGRYRDALASHQRVLALEAEYGASPRETALELSEIGIDYRHLGRFTDAVAVYDSALRLARQMGRPEAIARVEFNLANVRMATGDREEALRLLTDALPRVEQIGEVRGMAFIHGALADLYAHAEAYGPARAHFEHALAINRSARLPYGEVQNLEGLGRLEMAQHHPAVAMPLLRSALAIADSAPYGKERATTRAALARASAASGSALVARQWAESAVRIADSLGDPTVQVEARAALGAALEAGDDAGTSDAYVAAIDLLESWRGRLALGDLRMGVADAHLDVYEGAIRSLLSRHREEDALRIAERAKARLLLELMAEHDVRQAPHDVQRSEEDRARQLLRETFERRADARGRQAVAIDQTIDTLTSRLDAIQASARANDARAGMQYPTPASLSALRDGLLRTNRALLVFFWGDRDVYGWWITRDAVHARRLGSADSLAALLDFMRGTLSNASGPSWQPVARQAFDVMVAPLQPSAVDEVLVVTDGPLAYLPLETFLREDGGAPWGATTRFDYGPSASVLLTLQSPRTPARWTRQLLAVGDPTRAGPGALIASTERDRSGEVMLPDLPAAAAEARSVAGLVGGDAITGEQATLARWLAYGPERYRYLHFATHALLDDVHPERSAIVLAHGRLDLKAIRRLRLSTELVTLSACETGLGQRVRGEGIIGLPHAFMEAGARAVIVSLWKVRDQAAAAFMIDFYRELHAGRSPADAMRAVRQARLRAGGDAAHPSEWAAFILIGGDTAHAATAVGP